MYTMLAFLAILVVLTAIAVVFDRKSNYPSAGSIIVGGIFVAFFGTMILGLLVAGVSNQVAGQVTVSQNLMVLQDGQSVSGDFFLGIGSVSEDPSYTYYVESSDGTYELEDLDADAAKIRFTDGPPRIEFQCVDEAAIERNPWMLNFANECFPRWGETIFYVPEDSIKQDYNLDAKG